MQFSPSPIKPTITMSDLQKIDVRVGTIKSVDDVEGSSKLIKLLVDFGDQERTILVGMKEERANPREIVGMQTLFVVNLEPKKMAGHLSEGMLFDIGYADRLVAALAVPERKVPEGARVG